MMFRIIIIQDPSRKEVTCSNMGNLREFSTGTTYEAGGRIQGNYKEMVQNPRVKGDITCKPKELIAGGRSHRKRVQKRIERAAKGQSQPAVTF